jgi:siroheme synthase
MKTAGWVYFVGAGPGPLDLLTLRAERLLRTADLVAYDQLVEPELLTLVRADCELLPIGYRAQDGGAQHPILHDRILEAAQTGAKVVRLKSGDPLIFGRAAEEMRRLDEAGISYSAGSWPLTRKGLASSLRLLTWSPHVLTNNPAETLAIYMPRHGLGDLLRDLLDQGWSPATPAAYVQSALRHDQAIVHAALMDLPQAVEQNSDKRPGICLIGEALRQGVEPWLRSLENDRADSAAFMQ